MNRQSNAQHSVVGVMCTRVLVCLYHKIQIDVHSIILECSMHNV
jgi:hypothetical protein